MNLRKDHSHLWIRPEINTDFPHFNRHISNREIKKYSICFNYFYEIEMGNALGRRMMKTVANYNMHDDVHFSENS